MNDKSSHEASFEGDDGGTEYSTSIAHSDETSQALSQRHLDMLMRESGLTPEVINERGYRTGEFEQELLSLGFAQYQARLVPGLLVPLHGPSGTATRWQFRPDKPRIKDGTSVKYENPKGQRSGLDIPPRCLKDIDDPSVPLYITEGAKKADAIAAKGGCAISIAGVANWRGTNRKGGKVAIPDWNDVALYGRTTKLVFDSDVTRKWQVEHQLRQLTGYLEYKGATVSVVYLPDGPDGAKQGIDDFLARGHALAELVEYEEAGVRSVEAKSPSPSRFVRSDAGNAELFGALYGERVRYDHKGQRWLLFGPHHWHPDRDGELHRMAVAAARRRYRAAEVLDDLRERGAEAAYAVQSENTQRIEAMFKQARNLRPIADAGEWDANPDLLAVANGVVDLRTGQLRPGQPSDRLSLSSPVAFDPRARCPRWRQFVDEVFDDDLEAARFLQRAVGYSLTGHTREHALFLFHGSGGNGKSTMLNILSRMLGELAWNLPFSALEHQDRPQHSADIAAIVGKRLVTASETAEQSRFNEARIKTLAGGDPVTARHLYGAPFEFKPQAKFWLAVNTLPAVRDMTEGFWRRLRLIELKRSFTGSAMDKGLEAKLAAELPSILAWAIEGATEWYRIGLSAPDGVRLATWRYKEESDLLADFLAARVAETTAARVLASELFTAYELWALQQRINERDRLPQKAFYAAIRARFGEPKRLSGGMTYIGIGLLSDSDRSDSVGSVGSNLKSLYREPSEKSSVSPYTPYTPYTPAPESPRLPIVEAVASSPLGALEGPTPPPPESSLDGTAPPLCLDGCGTPVILQGMVCPPCARAAVEGQL